MYYKAKVREKIEDDKGKIKNQLPSIWSMLFQLQMLKFKSHKNIKE